MSTILHALTQHASSELTDGQLLGRYVTTLDAAAFETLVRRHGPMVLGVCRRLLPNLHDAEDAFQATFLVLVRKAATIMPREAVGSWLYGVAYRAAQKVRVAAARRRSKEVQVAQAPESATVTEGLWHDVLPLLDHELALLPEKYRLPIVLCDLEGKTRKVVARQLGWPEGTVAGRLASARKILAKRLARQGLPLSAGVLTAVFSESATQAAVPLTLVRATVRTATGAAVQTGISSIAEGVVGTMFLSNLKLPVLVLVAFTVVAAGGAVVVGRPQWADKGAPGRPDAPTIDASLGSEKQAGAREGNPDVVEETAWGEAVDGIQAGITANKHAFGEGEMAKFTVKVRNVSETAITVSYVSGDPGPTKPGVTSPAHAQPRVLMPPEPRNYRPTLSRSLKPGEVFEMGTARLYIQAASGTSGVEVPTLVARPGKYQIAYSRLAFAGTAGPDKVWVATGRVEIEVHDATKAQEKAETVSWGEAAGGVQAGLAYPQDAKAAYHPGEQVTFVVWLRNVSTRKATVSFWSPPADDAGPIVVGTDRRPLQAYPEVTSKDGKPGKVIPPPVWHYSPQVVERVLQPGEALELGRPTLRLVGENPSRKVAHPTLVAAPGSYRVHYPGLAGGMEFATGIGLLATGAVNLEVKPGVKLAEEPDPRPSDLSGNWQAVSFEQDGREKFSKEEVRKVTASFRDCRYRFTPLPWGPEGSFNGNYQIDGDSEEPKSFSLHPAAGVLKGQAFRGIYRVEGDTLTLCFSWPPIERPTEFRSRPNSTIVLAVFRRAKP